MKRTIVIGSGPAGCTAARYLAEKGHVVTLLERGYALIDGPMSACGTLVNGIARLNANQQPVVLGGGSAINYGVWATPPFDEWNLMWGEKAPHVDWQYFHANFASLIVAHVDANRIVTQSVVEASEALGIQKRQLDPSLVNGTPFASYDETGEWIKTGSLADETRDRRNTPLTLIKGDPRIRIHTGQCVQKLERGTSDPWRVHTPDAVYAADQIVVCAGTIGTAELLLKSDLAEGVSSRVGAQMHDHMRQQLLLCHSRRDQTPEPIGRVTEILVGSRTENRYHVEFAAQSNIEGAFNLGLVCTQPCCAASSVLRIIPSWLTCIPQLATNSFDPWCICGPFAPMCNALRCINLTTVVIGTRSDTPGNVSLSGQSADVKFPTLGKNGRSVLNDVSTKIAENSTACCVIQQSDGVDTEWHFAGTAPYGIATDLKCQVKAESGESFAGLFVGDLSLLHALPTLNTQAPAAVCGLIAAQFAANSSAPRTLSMSR